MLTATASIKPNSTLKKLVVLIYKYLHNFFLIGRALYKNKWLPFYFWLNEKFYGGRADAEKQASYFNWVRLGGATIATLGFLAMMLSPTGWVIVMGTLVYLIGASLVLYSLYPRAAAHTVEIQNYYDFDWVMQLLINEKFGILEMEPKHGFHSDLKQCLMILLRYFHDFFVWMGTVCSWIVSLSVLTPIGPAVVVTCTWGSAMVRFISALTAPLTHKFRLWIYARNLNEQITLYYDLCQKTNPDSHKNINLIIDKIFTSHGINKEDLYYQKYETFLKFICYRAIEDAKINENTEFRVIEFLKSLCENGKLSPKKLRNIAKTGKENSELDAIPILQHKLYQKLNAADGIELPELKKALRFCKPELVDTFILYFKSALLKGAHFTTIFKYNEFRWENELKKLSYFKQDFTNIASFDEEKLIEDWPVDTSHGKRLLPAHQIKKLAELFALQFDKKSEKNTEATLAEQKNYSMWFFEKLVRLFVKQPEKNPIIPAQVIKDEADKIWFEIVKGDAHKPEGGYNDHDQLYHFISLVTRNYIKKKLETPLTPEQKEKLILNLKKDIKSITDKSTLRYLKKWLGFSEYKHDSKSFSAKKINGFADIYNPNASPNTAYKTPCFIDADKFGAALEARRSPAIC